MANRLSLYYSLRLRSARSGANPSRAVTTPVFCSGAYGNLLASSASVWLNQETRGSMRLAVWFDALIRRCKGLLDLAELIATLRATFGSLRGANRGASDRGGQGQAHIAHTRGVWRQIVPNRGGDVILTASTAPERVYFSFNTMSRCIREHFPFDPANPW